MRLNLRLFKGGVASGSNAYLVDQGDGSGKNAGDLKGEVPFSKQRIFAGNKSEEKLLREMEEKWGEGMTSLNPEQQKRFLPTDRFAMGARGLAAEFRAEMVESGRIPKDARVIVTIEQSADRGLAFANLQGLVYRIDVIPKGKRKPIYTERVGRPAQGPGIDLRDLASGQVYYKTGWEAGKFRIAGLYGSKLTEPFSVPETVRTDAFYSGFSADTTGNRKK